MPRFCRAAAEHGPGRDSFRFMRDETGQLADVVRLADGVRRNLVRVLYVEDDELCREAIAGDLSDHGFLVHEFADTASLVDALKSAIDGDVILLDWGSPGTLRIDLLPELRRFGVDLPVVFLTGYTFDARGNAALESGAVDFIDKAKSMEVIVARLWRAVGARSKPMPKYVQPVTDHNADGGGDHKTRDAHRRRGERDERDGRA